MEVVCVFLLNGNAFNIIFPKTSFIDFGHFDAYFASCLFLIILVKALVLKI